MRYTLLGSAILFHLLLSAQESDASFNLGTLSSTGVINKTNKGSSYILNNSLKFTVNRRRLSMNLYGGWVYGVQSLTRTNNDYNASLDFNLFKKIRKIYFWGLLSYEQSYSLRLRYRQQEGGGIGYTLANSEKLKIVLSEGLLFETGNLSDTVRYTTVRNSARLKYKWKIGTSFQLDGINFLQNSLEGDDYIVRLQNNLSFKVNDWLNLTVSSTYNKLSGTRKENLLLNYGFGIQKYF